MTPEKYIDKFGNEHYIVTEIQGDALVVSDTVKLNSPVKKVLCTFDVTLPEEPTEGDIRKAEDGSLLVWKDGRRQYVKKETNDLQAKYDLYKKALGYGAYWYPPVQTSYELVTGMMSSKINLSEALDCGGCPHVYVESEKKAYYYYKGTWIEKPDGLVIPELPISDDLEEEIETGKHKHTVGIVRDDLPTPFNPDPRAPGVEVYREGQTKTTEKKIGLE